MRVFKFEIAQFNHFSRQQCLDEAVIFLFVHRAVDVIAFFFVATIITTGAESDVHVDTFGADNRRAKRLQKLIDTFIATIEVVSFDAAAATMFGRVCAALRSKGTPIGILDTLIAAHAMSLNLTLVTNNTKHFKQVHGLKTQNWLHEAG